MIRKVNRSHWERWKLCISNEMPEEEIIYHIFIFVWTIPLKRTPSTSTLLFISSRHTLLSSFFFKIVHPLYYSKNVTNLFRSNENQEWKPNLRCEPKLNSFPKNCMERLFPFYKYNHDPDDINNKWNLLKFNDHLRTDFYFWLPSFLKVSTSINYTK